MLSVQHEKLKEITDVGGNIRVGIDIGGTNVRVALQQNNLILEVAKFNAHSADSLWESLTKVLAELSAHHPKILEQISSACFACAGPISDDGKSVVITNWPVQDEEKTLHSNRFPGSARVRFINDLEGTCYGLLGLQSVGLLEGLFEPLWGEQAISLSESRYLVMAMGTGLGVALILRNEGKIYNVLPLEYGHTTVAVGAPLGDQARLEAGLVEYLSKTVWQGEQPPEYEDICSGRGLHWVYQYLRSLDLELPELTSAAAVIGAAEQGNKAAVKAVAFHYGYLMRNAKNLCVGALCKGVILAGDNQVRNREIVHGIKAQLKDEFQSHTKASWIRNVPVWAQKEALNINLYGCLFVAGFA